jgi:positive regulator of sigma E activity
MTETSFFTNQRTIIILIGFGFLSLFMAGFVAPTLFIKGFVTVISISAFVTALYYVVKEYEKEYAQVK